MEITFANKELQQLSNDNKKCNKKLGKVRAKLYLKRLSDLLIADNLEEVRHLPGRYHELTGNRKGQWTCDLDQPYRLIFQPHENPIPQDADGKYIWLEIIGVEIIEITDYH